MAYDRVRRRGAMDRDHLAARGEPRRTDEAAPPVATAGTLAQLDVLALQRTLGNAATAALLSRAPAPKAVTPPGRTPLKVQRSFLKKVKRRLGFGKKKPRAEELLADPTEWEETKVGPATGASSSAAKPKTRAAKAKAKAIRESRLEPVDTKSEGEDSVGSVKPRNDYSAYAPAGSLRDDAPYTVAGDDGKLSESVSESTSESESESEEKSSSELVVPPTRTPYRTAFPVDDEKSEDSEREAESESESDEQSFSEDEAPAQETADDELYEVDTEEAATTLYPEEAKAEAETVAEEDIEFSEDDLGSDVAAVASRLAPQQELKAAAPYPKTLSKDTHYDDEETEGTKDVEIVFLRPARQIAWHIVNNKVPSADLVGGENWVAAIKREGRKIAQARRAGKQLPSYGDLMRHFIGQVMKPSVHWEDEDIARYIDDNGMLRTDADHKAVVKYLGADERTQFELHREKGFFTQGAKETAFDTAGMATNLAGPGYGIYVMDSDGRMYAEGHKVGLFHHSSFLAGGDVAAAGELKVTNGALQTVTNKTGHYKAGVENLLQALDRFQAWGVSLSSFDVSLVTAGIRSRDQMTFEKADVFYRRERAKAGSA